MTEVTRKVYNTEGTDSVLGIPCETVTETWDGSVGADDVSVEDAFNVDEIDIDDNHSTGVVALAAKVTEVKMQERCVPTAFTKPKVYGFPINEDGSVNYDGELQEDEMTEVTLSEPVTVQGIPVYKIWQGSGDVSFQSIESSAVIDGRTSVVGYQTDGADKCVYSVLSASDASAIGALVGKTISGGVQVDAVGGGFDNEYTVGSKMLIAIPFNARNAMDSLCGVGLVEVGKNGGVPLWMSTAIGTYGIPRENLIRAYSEWSNIQYAFRSDKVGALAVESGTPCIPTTIGSNVDYVLETISTVSTAASKWPIVAGWGEDDGSRYANMMSVWANNARVSPFLRIGTSNGYQIANDESPAISSGQFVLARIWKSGAYIKNINTGDDYTKSFGVAQTTSSAYTFTIYAGAARSSSGNGTFLGKLARVIISQDNIALHAFVPFYRDGVYGMLDLVTETFYTPTNGVFEYSLE